MKTPLFLLKLAALVWLLLPASASAFYNPQAGRWLNRDPIQERGGLNLHSICSGDTVNHADLNGLSVAHTLPEEVWTKKFNIQRPGSGNAVTTGFFKITVNTASHSVCCCKLANATFSVKALTQFQGSSWNYDTVLHEGVHAWADWQMGSYAITTWIYQHTRCCINKYIDSPAACKKQMEESAKKLESKLDDLANSQTSVLGIQHHALIGTVGWSQAGEDAFVSWFWPWLNMTFPGGCLDSNGFHCRDVE
jgi:hypothetical protein